MSGLTSEAGDGQSRARGERNYGPPRLVVELTNVCNLHCSYCLRDEDALYHTKANFFSVELLRRVVREAREAIGARTVMFTGGETTLHPRFREVLETVGAEGLTCSFVTNGWHFERVWPAVAANRQAVTHVSFSLDGPTRETHDRWRGEGSFVRLVRAFARCKAAGLPFIVKLGLRRDTLPLLEPTALFAARMGAASLGFAHNLPTSGAADEGLSLSHEERTEAEQEIAVLASILKMRVTLEVGYNNQDPAPPCSPLAGVSCNVDYRGRLSLCCNLSGYRGAAGEADVVADLNEEGFAAAFARLQEVASAQLARRREALAESAREGRGPDIYLGSPCLFCLRSFGKIPWHAGGAAAAARTLPVLQAV
ncbi:MAG: radical SAM protein [Acidobacteria bacterium]|nr:radical SAM protein [Acidobacteriota bacterium]